MEKNFLDNRAKNQKMVIVSPNALFVVNNLSKSGSLDLLEKVMPFTVGRPALVKR